MSKNDITDASLNHRFFYLAASMLVGGSLVAGCAQEDDFDGDPIDDADLSAAPQSVGGAPPPRTPTIALPADPFDLPGVAARPGRTSASFVQPTPIEVPSEESIMDPNTGMCNSSPAFSRHMGRAVMERLPQEFFNYLEYGTGHPAAGTPMLPPSDPRAMVRDFLDIMGPETAYGVRYFQVRLFDPHTGTYGSLGPIQSCIETYSATAENPTLLVPHFHIAIKDNEKNGFGHFVRSESANWHALESDPTWYGTYGSAPYSLLRLGSLEHTTTTGCTSSGFWAYQSAGGIDTPCVELHDEKVYEFDPLGGCGTCYKGAVLTVLSKLGLWAITEGWTPDFHYDSTTPQNSRVELEPASYEWDEELEQWSFTHGSTTPINSIPGSKLTTEEQVTIAKNEKAWRVSVGLSITP